MSFPASTQQPPHRLAVQAAPGRPSPADRRQHAPRRNKTACSTVTVDVVKSQVWERKSPHTRTQKGTHT
ncbi:hypothetical protein SEA_DIRTMONSTER_22 [Mycobacterium phage DirtMonster]